VKERRRFFSGLRGWAAGVTLGGIVVWVAVVGPGLFSPGPLSTQTRPGVVLGGVSSHAQLNRNCGACHTAPWSGQSMTDRCLACHTDVTSQIQGHNGIHGTMLGSLSASTCQFCHPEHGGSLTANFNHSIFPINHGTNQQSSTCGTCHPNGFATYTCFGCHFHTPANVVSGHEGGSLASLQDCIRCHAGGRVPD
jgi:hypothetical protein